MADARPHPTLGMDFAATAALGLYSVAVAAGFARVFSGWTFMDNLIVLILVGHGASLILRRLDVSAWLAIPGTAILLVWTMGISMYRSTYTWGIPTASTWTLFQSEMTAVQDQFSVAVAPVFFGAGWDALAAIGIAIAVLLADTFAFHAFGRAEALVPGGVLFVFVGALGSDRQRVPLTLALIAAGVVATVALRAYHAPPRPVTAGKSRSPIRLLAPAAFVATIAIALTAGFVGPRLPGADAAPIYETRGRGGGITNVISPLIDIRSRLTNRSDSEMFVVQTNLESYWRSAVLPEFDGTTWGLPERPLEGVDQTLAEPRPGSQDLMQQISITNLGGSLVPAAADPYQASGPNGLSWVPDTSTLVTVDDNLSGGDLFEIASASPRFEVADLAAATSNDAGDPIYLELPDDLPSIVAEKAAEVTAGSTNTYETALALQNWFRDPNEFEYSLEIQPGHGNSAIESFLRERIGYCEQFAGTYAAMMRTLGIPSRVAVGFTSGREVAPGTYSVLGKNAHAWPEIWFDGLGWVPFEPTPGRGSPGAENYTGISAQQDVSAPETGESAGEATAPAPAPTTIAPNIADPSADEALSADEVDAQAEVTTEIPNTESGRTLQVLFLVALVGFLLALPALVRRWRLRRRGASTEQQLARLWRRSLNALADVGVKQSVANTPLETAASTAAQFPIAARPINSLAEVVTEAEYGDHGTEGYDVVGTYGSSTIRDCGNWCHQIERAVSDTISSPERIRRYFTRWG